MHDVVHTLKLPAPFCAFFLFLSFTLLYMYSAFLLFYMQILFLLIFFHALALHVSSMNWLPFAARPLRFSCTLSSLSALLYVFFPHLFSLRLFFNVQSWTALSSTEDALAVVTSIQSHHMSTKWYIRCIPVRMCMHVARDVGTKRRGQCFASALSWLCRRHVRYFNGVVPVFFFLILPFSRVRRWTRRFTDWKLKSEFNFIESIRTLSDILEKNRLHLLYIPILGLKYLSVNAPTINFLSKLNPQKKERERVQVDSRRGRRA